MPILSGFPTDNNSKISQTANDALKKANTVTDNFTEHENNTTKHITAADRETWNNKAVKPKCVMVSLPVSGWTGSGPYTQTVSVSGVTTANAVTPSPVPASWEAAGTAVVYCSGQAANTLTFSCADKPEVDLTYSVLIQEVV